MLWLGTLVFIFPDRISAQQIPSAEKPKIKSFGKSLKTYGKKKSDNKKSDFPVDVTNDEVIQVKTNLVVNDILVINQKGKVILGLKQDDFSITENGLPQQSSLFSFGENAAVPRSIVLIIDYSTSLYPYIKSSIAAARLLVDKLSPQDRMAIVTDDVKLLVEFTNDKKST